MTSEEKQRVKELRQQGQGYRTIANTLGLPVTTVGYYCRRLSDADPDLCPQCGAELEHLSHRKKKKFCSAKCRQLWWNDHQDQVNRQAYYNAVCHNCGKEFVSYGNDHRKFCSRDCYLENRKNKKG